MQAHCWRSEFHQQPRATPQRPRARPAKAWPASPAAPGHVAAAIKSRHPRIACRKRPAARHGPGGAAGGAPGRRSAARSALSRAPPPSPRAAPRPASGSRRRRATMAATVTTGSFTNARGQALFTLAVLPPPGAAKCVLVWAHGHFEHCRRKLKGVGGGVDVREGGGGGGGAARRGAARRGSQQRGASPTPPLCARAARPSAVQSSRPGRRAASRCCRTTPPASGRRSRPRRRGCAPTSRPWPTWSTTWRTMRRSPRGSAPSSRACRGSRAATAPAAWCGGRRMGRGGRRGREKVAPAHAREQQWQRRRLRRRRCSLPAIAPAHIAAPLISQASALAVLRWQDNWAGLVLFAPAVGVHMTPLTR
jgi:hypothetical protein